MKSYLILILTSMICLNLICAEQKENEEKRYTSIVQIFRNKASRDHFMQELKNINNKITVQIQNDTHIILRFETPLTHDEIKENIIGKISIKPLEITRRFTR